MSSKKLLLADDSVTIQRVIELTFSGEDIQVLAVSDGEEAIARIPTEKPDIVLADIGMPKRSGYEVCAFIKGRPDLAKVPVLLLAGAFEPVDEAKAQQVKCDGVLVKPFEPQHVIARVRELIGGAKGSPTQAVPDVPRPIERLAPPRPVELPKREDKPPIPADLVDVGEADLEPRVQESQPTAPALVLDDSLDDYFDKLDEAFASAGGSSGGQAAPPRSEPRRQPHPDRPVLERDLESFDEPTLVNEPPAHYIEAPRAPAPDPSAGVSHVEPFDAAQGEPFDAAQGEPEAPAAVPTLDDLLSRMPPAPAPEPITFEASVTPVIDMSPPQPVAVPPPIVVAPPSIEPPDVTPTRAPAPAFVPPPPKAPVAPAAGADSASSRSILADAFSALLAAEQGEPGAAPVRLRADGSEPVVTDAVVDEVARRVIERLALGSSDQLSTMVRKIVSDVAERLVREEIERIRSRQ